MKSMNIIFVAYEEANKIKRGLEIEIKEKKQYIFNLENNLLQRENNLAIHDNKFK